MIRSVHAALAFAAALLAIPSMAATVFRAPAMSPAAIVSLPAPAGKSAGASTDSSGRLRVGFERTLDKAVEAQTEFARQACETFATDSRKIRTLYQELFWQSLRLPTWPPGQARR